MSPRKTPPHAFSPSEAALLAILSAIGVEDGVAIVEGAGEAVELEVDLGDLAVAVDFEVVDALHLVRSVSEVSRDPAPVDLVAGEEDGLSVEEDRWAGLRLNDEGLLACHGERTKL